MTRHRSGRPSLTEVPHEFLSDEWINEARALRETWKISSDVPVAVRININVTAAPFSTSALAAHLDTTAGVPVVDLGHLDAVDLTITVEWAVAKSLFIDGQPTAALSAFLNGKIALEGDMTKLLELQNVTPAEWLPIRRCRRLHPPA